MSSRIYCMQFIEVEVIKLISDLKNLDEMNSFRLFLKSEIYKMLNMEETGLWTFSPLAIFDMWKAEVETGDPRNSVYLSGV